MKKLKIHPSFIVFIIATIFSGIINEILLMLFILCLHELGHIIVIRILKYEISSITLLPFGAIIDCRMKNQSLLKELLVYMSGLLVNIIIAMALLIIDRNSPLMYINGILLVFNLLPIVPLDGGKILHVIIAYFSPYKKSLKFLSYISYIALIFFFYWGLYHFRSLNMLFLFSYLFITSTKFYFELDNLYELFLLEKFLYPNNNLTIKKIKTLKKPCYNYFYKGKNNLIFNDLTFMTESQILGKKFEYYNETK